MIGRNLIGALFALALGLAPQGAWAAEHRPTWVGAWAASQQIPEPRNALPPGDLGDATLRQIVRLTAGGSEIRVRVSNVFGIEPLRFTAVHVARPLALDSARIDPASDRALTFSGRPGVVVPAGAEYVSDPVAFPVKPFDSLAISYHLARAPARQTSHPGSRATSYLARGNQVSAADLPGAKTVDHWYGLSGVDTPAGAQSAALVVLGDSITDGYGVKPNTNTRWTDFLAQRLQDSAATRHVSVLNHGIGGGRLLLDELGPNALARFERDVLAQTGVRYLIVLEGVNDLGQLTREGPASPEAHAAMVQGITGAYAQMVARARARGIKAIGATLLPFGNSDYYHPPPETEADRQAINAWIRTPGNFDAVIDFDALMRDPARPDRMRPEVDNDGLHPSIGGYRVMADAAPLTLFTK